MFEDLAKAIADLAGHIEAKLKIPVALSPADSKKVATGGLVAFIDAPILEPSRARLSGEGGQRTTVVLVAAGTEKNQVLELYTMLGRVLAVIPAEWAFQAGAVIQPVMVGDVPAYQIPIVR